MEKLGYYFAYGSNMNPERMRKRGVPFFSYRRAVLKDHRLAFNKLCRLYEGGFGCANVEPAKGEVVEGVLYEVDLSEAIPTLDYYEGYPNHYERKVLKVETDDGEVEAFVYIAHPSKVREGLKPSPEYLYHLLEACRLGLLSESYCERLKRLWEEITNP